MSAPIITYRNIDKAFGENTIYKGLNLDVFQGETLCIIGGSGTGKSVMLKMLVGLLTPESGDITAFGESIIGYSEKQWLGIRRKVAMLFQGGALFDSFDVANNIKFPLIEHKWGTAKEMDMRVTEVLEMVGLSGIEKLRPAELSGGMRKRVALARSIAVEPEVLLYDEPTTGLDPISIRRINGVILRLQEQLQVTSMVVTHEMPSAFTIGNRIAMVKDHKIGFVGSPDDARAFPEDWLQEFIAGGEGTLEVNNE
jgi:phospholipid/cholesterol/gamma-HCH transport system ATP-binding protein